MNKFNHWQIETDKTALDNLGRQVQKLWSSRQYSHLSRLKAISVYLLRTLNIAEQELYFNESNPDVL
jgi:hypothetical protein